MISELTLAIVTKKRPLKLERCLDSVCKQSLKPDQVLIVDNDTKKSAYPVFEKYKKRLPVQYVLEKKQGVPSARNLSLLKSKSKYLGFVDDDCILNKKWVESATKTIKLAKDTTYICGKTSLYNNNNIFALAQYSRDSYWYLKKIVGKNKTTAGNFDTKNVILNRKRILNKHLRFDPKCSAGIFDSADFDFGLQLDYNKLNGIYSDKMTLTHEETSNFKRYIFRAYNRGKIAGYINKKWELNDEMIDKSEKNIFIWLLKSIKKFPTDFRWYTKNLNVSIHYKIFVTVLTRIYERAYLMGYLQYKH